MASFLRYTQTQKHAQMKEGGGLVLDLYIFLQLNEGVITVVTIIG